MTLQPYLLMFLGNIIQYLYLTIINIAYVMESDVL